jgi:CBS domain-containing membrane protein
VLLAISVETVSHREKLLSALGGFVAILGIFYISHAFLASAGAQQLLLASMGASAVLLFAVPHGQLSQPWPLVGGHVLSAIIGVMCARYIGQPLLAASVAVGLAIGVMYYARCIHPPGGATALTAVMGGEAVHALGYQYVLAPVLLNVLLILAIAFLFNYPFAWRRYPAHWARRTQRSMVIDDAGNGIDHGDFVYALSQLDSFVDVSEDDLLRIYALATGHARTHHLLPRDIHAGRFYSNGKQGEQWSVRQVVDESASDDPAKDQVIYRVVDGAGRKQSAMVTRAEFSRWATHEVLRHGNGWKQSEAPSK